MTRPRYEQSPPRLRWPTVGSSYQMAIVFVLVFYAIGVFATQCGGV